MSNDARKDAIDIWLFKGTPLSEEVISAVYDSFFMTELPTEERTLWKLYNKALTMKWFRNGRLATQKEVELGLSDLTGEPLFDGLQNDIYTWIIMCTGRNANKTDYTEFMKKVIDLSNRAEQFTENVEALKRFKGIKYSAFEPDEKTSDVDILTVMNEVIYKYNKDIHGNNDCYKKAVYYSLKYVKYKHNIKEMMTHEKVTCRKAYEEMLSETKHSIASNEKNEKLKEDCETILKARGKELDRSDFVYKIVDTLSKSEYSKCSSKQKAFIDDALARIYSKQNNNEEEHMEKKVNSLMEEVKASEMADMTTIDLNDIFK